MDFDWDKAIRIVRKTTGIDLGAYRRPMLERRLAARSRKLRIGDLALYLRKLEEEPEESHRLIDTVGVNISSFFRNPSLWEVIAREILPEILDRKRHARYRDIRAWSAGCGTGEEAYTIAILVHKALKVDADDWAVRIFATDVDEEALQTAVAGTYPRERFKSTKLGILDEYFVPSRTGFEVRSFVRRMVRFSVHDLISPASAAPTDSVFGSFDLVCCRNVLIYFSRAVQRRVIGNLSKSLDSGGYLVLGESESRLGESESTLETVDPMNQVFRKRFR